MQKAAKITSKGQITVPHEIRRALGVGPGDKLLFEQKKSGEIRVVPIRHESPFAKWRGIMSLNIGPGKDDVIRVVRELRGE